MDAYRRKVEEIKSAVKSALEAGDYGYGLVETALRELKIEYHRKADAFAKSARISDIEKETTRP